MSPPCCMLTGGMPADNLQMILSPHSSISMTQLLTHSVAHSTKPSSRPKTKNQPLKKILSLVFSGVKVVKN